jgi:hypothetical protein
MLEVDNAGVVLCWIGFAGHCSGAIIFYNHRWTDAALYYMRVSNCAEVVINN